MSEENYKKQVFDLKHKLYWLIMNSKFEITKEESDLLNIISADGEIEKLPQEGIKLSIDKNELKIRLEDYGFFSQRYIIEVPLPFEALQDCYIYSAMDAPGTIKSMLMEMLGETINSIVLKHTPPYTDKEWLANKLNEVKIIIE